MSTAWVVIADDGRGPTVRVFDAENAEGLATLYYGKKGQEGADAILCRVEAKTDRRLTGGDRRILHLARLLAEGEVPDHDMTPLERRIASLVRSNLLRIDVTDEGAEALAGKADP